MSGGCVANSRLAQLVIMAFRPAGPALQQSHRPSSLPYKIVIRMLQQEEGELEEREGRKEDRGGRREEEEGDADSNEEVV